MSSVRDDAIRAALDRVIDPCSVASKVPMSIVELGLVDDVASSNVGCVTVSLMLTSLTCFQAPALVEAIKTAVGEVDGIEQVDVRIDFAKRWTPDRISDAAQGRLARRRQRARELVGDTAQQWRTVAAPRS